MLMTRFLYGALVLILLSLNGAALWQLVNNRQAATGLVATALTVNSVAWPLSLVIAYRIGQLTGVEHRRNMRAKAAAARRASSVASHTAD